MYFLGLDPSTKCTGFCVMDEHKNIIERGKIPLPNIDEAEKIYFQIEHIENLFKKYSLTKILCENQYSKLNIDTLKKLSRVSGAILSSAARYSIAIELIYPTSWRKVYHGSGKAKKEDTFKKVIEDYQIEGLVFSKDNDMTDSIGIASACVDLHKEENSA